MGRNLQEDPGCNSDAPNLVPVWALEHREVAALGVPVRWSGGAPPCRAVGPRAGLSPWLPLGLGSPRRELCGRLGDEVDQAAWWAGISMTSIPFWNLIPWTTFGNWFSPFNRRHVFAAALTSLNTMSLAVFADRAPFVRTVR